MKHKTKNDYDGVRLSWCQLCKLHSPGVVPKKCIIYRVLRKERKSYNLQERKLITGLAVMHHFESKYSTLKPVAK